MRVLIGLLSGWSYIHRRELVRETWMPAVKRHGHAAYFLMGVADLNVPVVDHDLVMLRCPDSYPTLPQRTRRFCEWALSLDWCWDVLYKGDDDTYIAPKRFNDFAKAITADYTGVGFHPQMPYHSGGDGYFLSRKAAEIIAREMVHQTGDEDKLVGQILNSHGIPTSYLPDMRIGTNNEQRRPQAGNRYVVAHGRWLTEHLWRDSHRQMTEE